MVKIAGFWKRTKNALGKLGEGVAKGVKKWSEINSKVLGGVSKVANAISPFVASIPYANTIVPLVGAAAGIGSKVSDFKAGLADRYLDNHSSSSRVVDFDERKYQFDKSNVGPPGQSQTIAEDHMNYRRLRGPLYNRYIK